ITVAVLANLFVSFLALAGERVDKLPERPSIGTFREEHLKSLPYMCECEFYRGRINGGTMVFATRNERTVGFAVVDGKLITLQRQGRPADNLCRKYIRYYERWVSGATTIVLDQHVTGSGAESCCYKGELTATV